MVRDMEQKVIAGMTEAMAKILSENSINPMQSMNLIGYAARQLVTDISCSVCIDQEQAVVIALGSMLPKEYLQALCENSRLSAGCTK